MNRIRLGQDSSSPSTITIDQTGAPIGVGPLPDISIDPNLLLMGGAVLGLAFLLRGAGRKVSSYRSHRRRRAALKKSLKEQLRSL